MNRIYKIFLIFSAFIYLSACSTVDGQGRYRIETIGNAKRSVGAVVISHQPVMVQSGTTGTGQLVGGTDRKSVV